MTNFVELNNAELEIVIAALDHYWHTSTNDDAAIKARMLYGDLVTCEGEPSSEKIHTKL